MSGQFNVNVESGQFVKADPGIAKLLGVLSLQSLPRRLALDFRDVFPKVLLLILSAATSTSTRAWPTPTTCRCGASMPPC
jgi:hypothetical protein